MASDPYGAPKDPTGEFYLHPEDQRKAVQKFENHINRLNSNTDAFASFQKTRDLVESLVKEEKHKVETFPQVMLQGIKTDERYNGRYIPRLIEDQLMYISNTQIEVDRDGQLSYVPFSCIRYLNFLNCWVVGPYSLTFNERFHGRYTEADRINVHRNVDTRNMPDSVVAYFKLPRSGDRMLNDKETPDRQLNELSDNTWHVYSGLGVKRGYGREREFKLDENVKVTEAPDQVIGSDGIDFKIRANEKRSEKTKADRRDNREIAKKHLRTKIHSTSYPIDINDRQKTAHSAHFRRESKKKLSSLQQKKRENAIKSLNANMEVDGGSISKSYRYTKKSKTAKKRKNKRKTMRR
jgi:hypothetical protein